MAIFNAARLAGPIPLSTSDAQIITPVIAGQTVIVKQLMFTNCSGSAVTLNANLVPSGGSVITGNKIVCELSIGAYSNLIFAVDLPMVTNEFLTAKASTNSVVNITVTGIVIT
jgi:hypothetical protein